MKGIKIFSIISIVYLVLSLFILFSGVEARNISTARGIAVFGILAMLYSVVYSIIILVASIKGKDKENYVGRKLEAINQLVKIGQLREKDIITAEEFNQKKLEFLHKLYY